MVLKLLVMVFSVSLTFAQAKNPNKDLEAELTELSKSLLPYGKSKSSNLKTAQCQFDKTKWLMMLVSKQGFEEELSFNKECDLKGTYKTAMGTPFPIQLQLRNFYDYNQLVAKFLVLLDYDSEPKLTIKLIDSNLKSPKKTVKFSFEYMALIDPLSQNIIKKDLGGTLIVHSIDKKKIEKSIKIPPGQL